MVIKTTLSKDLFVRLSILRHIQRPTFYVYALLAAGLTVYTYTQGRPIVFLFMGWIPLGLYLFLGVISAIRASRMKDAPYFLPTEYNITDDGVAISSARGESNLEWKHFEGWREMVSTYVLVLEGGAILAIPQDSVPPHKRDEFEDLLRKNIDERGSDEATGD